MKMKITTLERQNQKIRSYRNHDESNNLLRGYQRDFHASYIRIDISSSKKTAQLNGFFTPVGVEGMVEEMDYRTGDNLFPFIPALIDKTTGYNENSLLTTGYTAYSDVVSKLLNRNRKVMDCTSYVSQIKELIHVLKKT